MRGSDDRAGAARSGLARAFTLVVDAVYVGLALLLAACAMVLLVSGIYDFIHSLMAGTFQTDAVRLLDRILLILLVVELLYTVQVSFREHALVPEPFLLVGLIAAIRRVLLLTAEFGQGREHSDDMYRHFFTELIVLTALILVVAVSLVLVRKRALSPAEQQGRENSTGESAKAS